MPSRLSSLLTRPLPEPPAALRVGPLRPDAFPSRMRSALLTVRIGRWLGAAFAVCFLTGLISHYLQQPPSWLPIPSRPVWGYRLTQGLHVAAGIAAIPLLLAKLWTVYPRLWAWPPLRSVLHAVERLSVFALVSSAVFELATGLINTVQWYPWAYYFPRAHYYVAWIAAGAITVHLGVKLPIISTALASRSGKGTKLPGAAEPNDDEPNRGGSGPRGPGATDPAADPNGAGTDVADPGGAGISRRGLLVATGTAVGAVTLTTVGQTFGPLSRLTLFAPRRPDIGPQHVPINRTAAAAAVLRSARDPAYRLVVDGPRPFSLSRGDLLALPQYEAELPITCVEGWSAVGRWRGVRLRDLLDRAGARPGAHARVVSMERTGLYTSSDLGRAHAHDELTLLALELNGEPLAIDHGYPLRLIAPNRPGVLQTKWVHRLEVL